ncbi:MAG: hypothetical protein EBX20_10855 [Rhodobacterales bacterium]|nr:hypothetical protein [Rhodobacterales bacterium]
MRSAYVLSFTQWGLLAWSTYVITKRAFAYSVLRVPVWDQALPLHLIREVTIQEK